MNMAHLSEPCFLLTTKESTYDYYICDKDKTLRVRALIMMYRPGSNKPPGQISYQYRHLHYYYLSSMKRLGF